MCHNSYLKSLNFLFLLLLLEIQWGLAENPQEDCAKLNDSSVEGGEVCGTDGKTYANSKFLGCINNLKKTDIAIVHEGKCIPGRVYCDPDLIYSPVCGSDNQTWPNEQALKCNNLNEKNQISIKSRGECSKIDYCYRNSIDEYGLNPVCGSNGYTYGNAGQVKCLQKYNDLKILHDGGCHVAEVYPIFGNGDLACHISKERNEWNPVCGDDGNTYPNPFIYLCQKPNLKVRVNTECNTTSGKACVTANKNAKKINGAYVNEDFTPKDRVCGNDGETQRSIYHLQCKTLSNKYLAFQHGGPCEGPEDNPCGAVSMDVDSMPVCSHDGTTYISIQALFCARRHGGKKIKYRHDGPC
ncbi:serine protease inhibitor dipetalogastin [Diachasma alloeum]|uniref:serine protease inhibitor dipetalogastin n=1 Tax=Diachasma alloeum TaxID=454923 RepID=UPI0007381FE7|nr:serine protease inhibitor dipetalogastin [Diachasma alloeum]